jgi:hypothetical protein
MRIRWQTEPLPARTVLAELGGGDPGGVVRVCPPEANRPVERREALHRRVAERHVTRVPRERVPTEPARILSPL